MPLLGEEGAANMFLSYSFKNCRTQGLERTVESMSSSLSFYNKQPPLPREKWLR